MYHSGTMSVNSNSSNCSNSTNSTHNSGSCSNNSINGSIHSAANSTKISPSSSGITTPTRISIKEANDHLQLLHSRVSELEEIIRHQSNQSAEQDEIYRRQLKELKSAKEAQIDELTKTIVRLEEKVKDIEFSMKSKNERLEENQTRLAQVDHLVEFLPGLEELLNHLKKVTATDDTVISPVITKDLITNSNSGLSSQDIINNGISDAVESLHLNTQTNFENGDSTSDLIDVDSVLVTPPSSIDIACQTDITGVVEALIKAEIPLSSISGKSIDSNNNNTDNDRISTSGVSTISSSVPYELCSSEPCFSKRSSIDETSSNRDRNSLLEERVSLPICGDNRAGTEPIFSSERQINNVRVKRQRRVRKSLSSNNCQLSPSNSWSKDFYCGPSLNTPLVGPGRTIGYKIHSNNSSHLSGKVEKSFSITSNFSEDEDIPTNGSRAYHK